MKPSKLDKLENSQSDDKPWSPPLGQKWFIVFAILFLFFTIIKLCSNAVFIPIPDDYLAIQEHHVPYDLFNLILYGIWIIAPPLFFLVEYVFIFGKDESRRMNPKLSADLKYCHELASKVWVAIGVLLSIILFLKYDFKL